ncbi:hypothetical protein PpBr36_09046 [Pyricularia pennisetigena]|uniref:hypothetical protein n=1 Tax=Pyricularia pennisetigena TaxID=1578925 RepID=UPI00114FE943|nr:hypothetical protein PpBr36_09046 [Pyricularia pennisetigena]TLS24377.1 hypothetical protein PpBr36_09046 [Pyricularia pennisetigena]
MAVDERTRNPDDLNTDRITSWRSIVTLIVFVIANVVVLFPFRVPIFIPRWLHNAALDGLAFLRLIPHRSDYYPSDDGPEQGQKEADKPSSWLRYYLPINFLTGPLIADIFLLAILAIGRKEVVAGTYGAENIHPIDIMLFFITLAYIAISIDASGLIRYMAFRVLKWGGKNGHLLFFYLYAFFFGLGSFIGNDPIILSGTAFLAYMTRVSSNIVHPRAWIYTQFAIANIASAILVSSNPTNLVLAGAFSIRFIDYTANMIVPVVCTVVILFPFLLYIVFSNEELIPKSIEMHELPEHARGGKPINPNIPHARGNTAEGYELEETQVVELSLEEIMNPFLDKKGALFGAVIMAVTLITVLAVNAAMSSSGKDQHVYYVTVPAATLMLLCDLSMGWMNRHDTRRIAKEGRQRFEDARTQSELRGTDAYLLQESDRRDGNDGTVLGAVALPVSSGGPHENVISNKTSDGRTTVSGTVNPRNGEKEYAAQPSETNTITALKADASEREDSGSSEQSSRCEKQDLASAESRQTLEPQGVLGAEVEMKEREKSLNGVKGSKNDQEASVTRDAESQSGSRHGKKRQKSNLVHMCRDAHIWAQETFPTVMAVFAHLPFALIPFAFCMFVLVQGLVSSGWVPVFAYGWDHWVTKTGTVGAIGGMGFLSVVLCNFSGTNIGTTILLCRVIQAWQAIHDEGLSSNPAIKERDFWATVYSMAIGVNYGAFSTTFSASLAGLLWHDILKRKHIHVRALEFARVNLPIIAVSMVVGCAVLVGEVYLMRKDSPLQL